MTNKTTLKVARYLDKMTKRIQHEVMYDEITFDEGLAKLDKFDTLLNHPAVDKKYILDLWESETC